MTKIAGSRSRSGSIRQMHGSPDPDPDPYQNVVDPQHWSEPLLGLDGSEIALGSSPFCCAGSLRS
jgi:hypothetical protein